MFDQDLGQDLPHPPDSSQMRTITVAQRGNHALRKFGFIGSRFEWLSPKEMPDYHAQTLSIVNVILRPFRDA